jgi:hypothetical protein
VCRAGSSSPSRPRITNVTDQYAFANFRKDDLPGDIPQGTRDAFGCAQHQRLLSPAAKIPKCIGGVDEDGDPCGTKVGGPCAGVGDAWPPSDVLRGRGSPERRLVRRQPLWLRPGHRRGDGLRPRAVQRRGRWRRRRLPHLPATPGARVVGRLHDAGLPHRALRQSARVPAGTTSRARTAAAGASLRGRRNGECQADCTAIYGDSGYCFHSGGVAELLEDHDPYVWEAIDAAQDQGEY